MSGFDWSFWEQRSLIMRSTTLTMTTGIFIQIVAIVTPFWVLTTDHENVGLFTFLYKEVPDIGPGASVIFLLFSCVSLVVAVTMTVINFMWLHNKYVMVVPALIATYIVAALSQMVPVVILAMHVVYLDVSWSDWMAIAVIGLYLISAALCMVEYSKHRGRFVLEPLPTEEESFLNNVDNSSDTNTSQTRPDYDQQQDEGTTGIQLLPMGQITDASGEVYELQQYSGTAS